MTFSDQDILARLQDDLADRFCAAIKRHHDPLKAAAALECSDHEIDCAARTANTGPLAWIECLPIRARSLMRRLGFIRF